MTTGSSHSDCCTSGCVARSGTLKNVQRQKLTFCCLNFHQMRSHLHPHMLYTNVQCHSRSSPSSPPTLTTHRLCVWCNVAGPAENYCGQRKSTSLYECELLAPLLHDGLTVLTWTSEVYGTNLSTLERKRLLLVRKIDQDIARPGRRRLGRCVPSRTCLVIDPPGYENITPKQHVFEVWGLRFRNSGLEFGVWGLGYRVQGLWFMVQNLGLGV